MTDINNIYSFMYCTYFDDGGVVEGDYSNYRELKECVCGNITCKSYDCIGMIKIIDNDIHIIGSYIQINFEFECGGWKFKYYAKDVPTILIKWIKMIDTVFIKNTFMFNPNLDKKTFAMIEESIKIKANSCRIAMNCNSMIELPYELWLNIYEILLTYEEYIYVKYKKEFNGSKNKLGLY